MKKVFSLIGLIALVSLNADAGHFIQKFTSAGGEDSCSTSGLVISWHMENLDLANEDGCSVVGDSVWTDRGANIELSSTTVSDGTYSAHNAGAYLSMRLEPTQNMPDANGTIWFDLYIDVWDDYKKIAQFEGDTNDYIRFDYEGTSGVSDIRVAHSRNGTIQWLMCNSNLSNTQWYRLKYEWDINAGGSDHQITIWELDNSTPRVTTGSPTTCGPEDNLVGSFGSPIDLIDIVGYENAQVYQDVLRVYDTDGL
jgi:hypothetical protein